LERWHYLYSGLRITSELRVPEWQLFETSQPFGQTDVTIRVESHILTGNQPVITAGLFCFHVSKVGCYVVKSGCEITVSPLPEADEREARLFLLGSAWGALCYQRGVLALHASVVQSGDYAVAFCGTSGAGKSSIAAWLTERGYRLVSDDLCRFAVIDGIPRAHPSTPRLKLWREALGIVTRDNVEYERDCFRFDKFQINVSEQITSAVSAPLRAIYLLEWGEVGLARLTGLAALRRFITAATYRGDLLEPMGQTAAHWNRCADLLRNTPVWVLSRPRDWAAMDAMMERLTTQWQNKSGNKLV
jgi:hypothetical protein